MEKLDKWPSVFSSDVRSVGVWKWGGGEGFVIPAAGVGVGVAPGPSDGGVSRRVAGVVAKGRREAESRLGQRHFRHWYLHRDTQYQTRLDAFSRPAPMSYALQAPRARPPPLQVEKRASYNPSILNNNSEPLLYNLPTARSMSPPTSPGQGAGSPRSPRSRLTSPTSPTFAGRSRTPVNGRPVPSPNSRNRSTTPLGVAAAELDRFAEYCRAWYFDQDDASGRLMTSTLANLPSSQRAPYSRLQASIRSAYHRSVNARRTAEFRAHLTATHPGGSLMPHARANPRGNVAKKERYERFERFVRNWCTMGMPGPQPFFQALWAVMRLQIVPEGIGGAGRNRIEWEFDDAVLRETGGKDFMVEAIDVLKGVLAFEEAPSNTPASAAGVGINISGYAPPHARSSSTPILSQTQTTPNPAQPKRARAPSDPFLDTPAPPLSSSLSSSPASGTSVLLTTPTSDDMPPFPPPANKSKSNDSGVGADPFDQDDDECEVLRIWTAPDLPNPEFVDLLRVFPGFVTRRALPRFPVLPAPKDLEEGSLDAEAGERARLLRFGTGTMWVGGIARGDGWEGGWWTRWCLWWKQVFC
ncbi:hypothetical protein K438DRAFT_1929594 [Mycena galopus ATCC 62051]|nr:hypothetical protein K438DRAFT_1929594 [Mycena galopus ATCC 62051]